MKTRIGISTLAAVVLIGAPWTASAQDQAQVKERVQAIKENLVQSKAALKGYEWVETTVVSRNGEEKSRVQKRCFYGADGKLQKTPLGEPAAEAKKKGGVRGKVVAKKKAEIGEEMKEAKQLIQSYVPPEPGKIQACQAKGKASVTPVDPGKLVRVDFKDYNKPGDVLGIEVDLEKNQLTKLNVASYLKKTDEAVTLDATLGTLEGGITYPAQIVFDVKSTGIKTVIENSGYKKTGT